MAIVILMNQKASRIDIGLLANTWISWEIMSQTFTSLVSSALPTIVVFHAVFPSNTTSLSEARNITTTTE